jgi:nicotinamide phosphoribosyltransferase
MNNIVPFIFADAYKISHEGFQPIGTEYIHSNQTARTGKYLGVNHAIYDNKTVFFSLQHFIKEFLIETFNKDFFHKPKAQVIKALKRRFDTFLGQDSVDMKRFEDIHDLGYLPISIKALPEGSIVPYKVPYFTIINTDPRFAWLTNYLETIISCEVWKPCYVATLMREIDRVCRMYADKTVGNYNHIPFQKHGFEFRGMSGRYDASICASAFLLYSCGTDTVPAVDLIEQYYNGDAEKELIACSVPASEHAVSSIGTAVESELEFFRRAITKCYPTGIVSLVSDTYDYFKVITEYATLLKEDILNRKVNNYGLAKVVFRPDSGDQVDIICGDKTAPVGSPQYKGTVECLWDIFGGTVNAKGYKELNPRVGTILGDGCTQRMIEAIFAGLEAKGFASNNIVFGIGSFSLNMASRDSIGAAQKATWTQVNGVGYDIYKDPVTDTGKMKKSAKGLLRVDLVNGEYVLKDQCTKEEEAGGELKEVFRDGKLLIDQTFAEIRARAQNYKV